MQNAKCKMLPDDFKKVGLETSAEWTPQVRARDDSLLSLNHRGRGSTLFSVMTYSGYA